MDNNKLNQSLNKAKKLQASSQLNNRSRDPEIANSVYPWTNHDYDYQQYVKNNYTPKKMGISSEPCIDVTIDDGLKLPNYAKAAMFDQIPKNNSVAGVDDVDYSNPDLVKIRDQYKKFKEPYPGFRKEYPEYFPQGIQGPYSSSYFVHTGYCPTKIKSRSECKKKGFTWVPNPIKMPASTSKFFPGLDTVSKMGGCHKPRYSYVNNRAGDVTGLMNGMVPTIGKEVSELNPISFINIFMTGSSPSGDFSPLPCREGFLNKSETSNKNHLLNKKCHSHINTLLILLMVIILMVLIYHIHT